MQAVYCSGTLKTGRLTGKPCRKYLGKYTSPYETAPCSRCGQVNKSEGSATEYGQTDHSRLQDQAAR